MENDEDAVGGALGVELDDVVALVDGGAEGDKCVFGEFGADSPVCLHANVHGLEGMVGLLAVVGRRRLPHQERERGGGQGKDERR